MSVDPGTIAHLFEQSSGRVLSPEAIAGLEEMFERWRLRTPTTESTGWMEQIGTAVPIENRAVAAQLVAIWQLFGYRLAQCSETEDWACVRLPTVLRSMPIRRADFRPVLAASR
jgi:hypothetical protein